MSLIIIRKLIFIIFSLFIIYLKPKISLIIIFIYIPEYFYLTSFLADIYKNFNDYYLLEVENADISSLNILKLWDEICKLQAFKRLYILFSRKKLKRYDVLIIFIIFFANIPFKFLRLFYYFIVNNKHSFRYGLEIYYSIQYNSLKESKIEVLNKEIYLNCVNLGKMLNTLKINKSCPEQKIFDFLHDLKLASTNFKEYEENNEKYIKMFMSKSNTDKNIIPHYTYKEKDNTIHSTSKIPNKITEFQKIESPMPSLIKKNALNPGSIVTRKVEKIYENKSKYIIINEYEISSIKFNNIELFNLNNEMYKYIAIKNNVYKDIIEKNIIKHIEYDNIVNDLKTNVYAEALSNSKNIDFINLLKELKDKDE